MDEPFRFVARLLLDRPIDLSFPPALPGIQLPADQ